MCVVMRTGCARRLVRTGGFDPILIDRVVQILARALARARAIPEWRVLVAVHLIVHGGEMRCMEVRSAPADSMRLYQIASCKAWREPEPERRILRDKTIPEWR